MVEGDSQDASAWAGRRIERRGVSVLTVLNGYIYSLEANCRGDEAAGVRVIATYSEANILGSISFDVPVETAKRLHIGQKLDVDISIAE